MSNKVKLISSYREILERQYQNAVEEFENKKNAAAEALLNMDLVNAYERDAGRILNIAGINASAVRAMTLADQMRQYDFRMSQEKGE